MTRMETSQPEMSVGHYEPSPVGRLGRLHVEDRMPPDGTKGHGLHSSVDLPRLHESSRLFGDGNIPPRSPVPIVSIYIQPLADSIWG